MHEKIGKGIFDDPWIDYPTMVKEVGRIGGFAAGNYTAMCRDCNRRFNGDKRASQCLPCAVKGLYPCFGESMEKKAGLTRTTFEGARAYANGLEERYRDHGLCIVLYIGNLGVIVEAYFSSDRNKTAVHQVISWHEIEMGLYDALRSGIDKACREIGLGV